LHVESRAITVSDALDRLDRDDDTATRRRPPEIGHARHRREDVPEAHPCRNRGLVGFYAGP